MRRTPPRKRAGQATKPRRIDGVVKDVAATAVMLGETEKAVRTQTARGLLPHRKLGGRIIYLEREILTFLEQLPGVTLAQALANVAARQGEEARP